MHNADFEEKDFEGPLYSELLFGSHRTATPGQVFENAFGIDAILEAHHPLFWDVFGHHDIPLGISLPDFRWGWVWRRYHGTRTLPSFPVNLLIQAKRPQRLEGRRADFAARGIDRHYWRFFITPHQQRLLERLEAQLHNRALVVYASAAFDTLDTLYKLTEAKELVTNSSFVRPSRLVGHDSWNYNSPGSVGIAASEPENIKDVGLLDHLDTLVNEIPQSDPKEDLVFLSASISEVIESEGDNPIAKYFQKIDTRMKEFTLRREQAGTKFFTFVRIQTFFSLLGLSWIVYGKTNEK